MRHAKFAEKLRDLACQNDDIGVIKDELKRIKSIAMDSQEYLLSVGYAIHYADNEDTQFAVRRIMVALGDHATTQEAKDVSQNSGSCNFGILKPLVSQMVKSANGDIDLLASSIADAVYYSDGSRQQSAVLQSIKSCTKHLSSEHSPSP